jgi:hypothetical protein
VTALEVLRFLAAGLAVIELLVMAVRWDAWRLLSRPMRWLFLGLAGQAAAGVYATWELATAGVPAGPRSCFSVLIQAWLLIGVMTYMPRRARLRSRLRRWRRRRIT